MDSDPTLWVMPEWMEQYREYITNTGGNSIEELMNDRDCNARSNHIRWVIICMATAQIHQLMQLHKHNLLKEI